MFANNKMRFSHRVAYYRPSLPRWRTPFLLMRIAPPRAPCVRIVQDTSDLTPRRLGTKMLALIQKRGRTTILYLLYGGRPHK